MTSKQPRILVVDDDPEWCALMKEVLEAEGYVVRAAESGQDALTTLPRFRPAAVVTDLNMPAMDGRALIASMRQRGVKVPVIVATSDWSEGQAPDVPGAFRVIEKAIPVEGLLSTLADAAQQKAAPAKRQPAALRPVLSLAARAPRLAGGLAVAAVMLTSAALLTRSRGFL
jgi:two-component system response regulator MprA